MTDKLILTTAQREQSLTAFKEVDALLSKLNQPRHRGLEAAIAMLQSLPMVEGEPVAFVMGIYADTSDEISVSLPRGMALYALPQPLQPITADDVADQMVDTKGCTACTKQKSALENLGMGLRLMSPSIGTKNHIRGGAAHRLAELGSTQNDNTRAVS